MVESTGAVFESKFMLPWYFSEQTAVEKYAPQLQHNMRVISASEAALSIITGGGHWLSVKVAADPVYQHLLVTAERNFWRSVVTGEPPRLFNAEPPRPRVTAVRLVDMSGSNSWSEFAGIFRRTRGARPARER
jgi:hypothetical protein